LHQGVENWSEVARRRVDDLQHLGGRGLLLQRLVTLGLALGELTSQISYKLSGSANVPPGVALICGPRRDQLSGRSYRERYGSPQLSIVMTAVKPASGFGPARRFGPSGEQPESALSGRTWPC
jgi:hypothetical protein